MTGLVRTRVGMYTLLGADRRPYPNAECWGVICAPGYMAGWIARRRCEPSHVAATSNCGGSSPTSRSPSPPAFDHARSVFPRAMRDGSWREDAPWTDDRNY